MRILVAHNVSRDYPGGMMRLMHFTHDPLAVAGHTVEYFCSEDVPARWNGPLLRRFIFPWLVYRKARQAFESGQPYDIVNVHEPVSALIAKFKRRTEARVVVTSHGLEERAWQLAKEEARLRRKAPALRTRLLQPTSVLPQCRIGLANADHVFCLNDDDYQYLKVHYRLTRDDITRVFPGALEIYTEASAGRDYSRCRNLLFAGTWRKNKGIEDFVPAVAELMQRYNDLELRVLGGGIPKEELLSSFPEGLHARIHLLHTKSDADNAAIMADSDIFVLPSLFEGTPLTLMEAMASGLPIVTTATCGMKDVIADGRNGLLTPIRDSSLLRRTIERLISNADLRRTVGLNAQRDAVERYTWNNSAGQVSEAYEKLLQLPSPASGPRTGRMLFAIHTPRDANTAVYKNTRERAAFVEGQGYDCAIVCPEDFPWIRRFGTRFTPLLYPLALAWWLFRRAADYDVAAFHSYAGWLVLWLSTLIRRFGRLRTVVQFHGLEPLYYARLKQESDREGSPLSWRYRLISGWLMPRLLREGCRRADMLLCLNAEEKRFLAKDGWAESHCIQIVSNPVPPDFFIERQHRERALRLLFVGQWLSMKGTRYLVEAFTRLHREHPDVTLGCVGTLASEDDVLASFPPEVRPHVRVIPRVTKSEMLDFHRDSDLFVFPTLSEGFSLALIEAMASGLPIVTTRVGAAPDILEDGISAVFCPTNDSDGLAAAIGELVNDRRRREQLGRNAQEAARRFQPDAIWAEYAACLNRLNERDIEVGRRIPVASAIEKR